MIVAANKVVKMHYSVLDNDGNNIELWEPVDGCFTELYEGKTTK